MSCKLTRKALLYRSWQVVTEEGWFTVEYDGRGMGYESVRVDGSEAVRTPSYSWFVPRFEFTVGSLPARVEVRVWPWLSMRAIRLYVNNRPVYAEGG
jgi:hypothetical protein